MPAYTAKRNAWPTPHPVLLPQGEKDGGVPYRLACVRGACNNAPSPSELAPASLQLRPPASASGCGAGEGWGEGPLALSMFLGGNGVPHAMDRISDKRRHGWDADAYGKIDVERNASRLYRFGRIADEAHDVIAHGRDG